MRTRIALTAGLFGLLWVAFSGCHSDESAPRGEGKAPASSQSEEISKRAMEILHEKCTVCHGSERFKARHFTEEEWEAVIRRMVSRGAELSGEEMDVLRHFRASE